MIELELGISQYDFPVEFADKILSQCRNTNSFSWDSSKLGQNVLNENYRSSIQFNINRKKPLLAKEIKEFIIDPVRDYCSKFMVDVIDDEGFSLLKYGQSNKYDYHVDDGPITPRVISMLIYLNTSEYDGGETHFERFNLYVKPHSPALVLFPSNYIYRHAALPVKSGEKFVIVSWFRNK